MVHGYWNKQFPLTNNLIILVIDSWELIKENGIFLFTISDRKPIRLVLYKALSIHSDELDMQRISLNST